MTPVRLRLIVHGVHCQSCSNPRIGVTGVFTPPVTG